MNTPTPSSLLLLCLLCDELSAFLLPSATSHFIKVPSISQQTQRYYHPAVEGWEEKYINSGGDITSDNGPKMLSDVFEVHAATETELSDLDVLNWPTWTTSDKEKWSVGNQVMDKEMPYGELSYVTSGKLEIIPQDTGVPVMVSKGDFVTFPRGFVASWKVLEELTWHYYLY